MAKVEGIGFVPYKIVVETEEEHRFLHGLFYLGVGRVGFNSHNFDERIHHRFRGLLNAINTVIDKWDEVGVKL